VATLNTHTRYLHDTILDYAEKFLATFSARLGHVLFTWTGSEANDLAYRIAKSRTVGTGVIVTSLAYHGITDAVSQFSPSLGQHVPLGSHVRTVPAPDAYRRGQPGLGKMFANDVRAALADMRAQGIKPAMMICDTTFSSDGVLSIDWRRRVCEILQQLKYSRDGHVSGGARRRRSMTGIGCDQAQPPSTM
jgi:4-aminobutyrate aminotransferase-like enzyme